MIETAANAPYGKQKKYSYLDHNATTPLSAELLVDVNEYLLKWGNPSSIHWAGRAPKTELREARSAIAKYLGVHPLELIFTSGGSEANNLAIKGVFELMKASNESRQHYVCSSVEHPSVIKTFEYLRTLGAQVDFIPVNREGVLDIEACTKLISEKTALVSVMFANNETGHMFPIADLVKRAHEKGALFHCDAVQSLGKAPIDIKALGVDLCSFSGHKVYAPKGCGLLYNRSGLKLPPLIHGGAQERGRRAGTENLWPFVGLSKALPSEAELAQHIENMRDKRDRLEKDILEKIPGAHITGAKTPRLPNTSHLIIDGVNGESLLMSLDVKGYAVSTGAACSSGSPEPSSTLLNMGFDREETQSSLRLSLGWQTTTDELKDFVETLVSVVQRLREYSE